MNRRPSSSGRLRSRFAVALLVVTLLVVLSVSMPFSFIVFKGSRDTAGFLIDMLSVSIGSNVAINVLDLTETCFTSMRETMDGTVMHKFLSAYAANHSLLFEEYGDE
ncbi:uncharacterized protein EV422DRAFT_372277 [Fimicolochytrium jonesii]|uniref:uncharacterized protein n=1 Tax=Fimicolochytrium jonesii TaxID=1396493 RepID=UPI0022FF21F4|nr:uncharacterized protein EV422DRAFT_372277 [Fimicolochytrium jonesii]KAI8815542.1 hypothetical protein EV422DRAFT_372277 [Fimicolochytrium jonesii]